MALTKRIVHLRDFADEANKLRKTYGKTSLYSSGQPSLDEYFGGGYGRPDGYEIVVLYGPTGVGKSTVGLNFLRDPVTSGRKVGMLVLEDDGADVFNRFTDMLGKEDTDRWIMGSDNIHFTPQEALVKAWKLDDLVEMIEDWFVTRQLDVIMLDHLQFAFESAEAIKGENEYIAQRVFMQKLNQLMKQVKKTIILVSHVNKAGTSKGMDKIVGSGAIAQAGTKVIEVSEDDVPDRIRLNMRKTRFTKRPGFYYVMKLVDGRLESAAESTK